MGPLRYLAFYLLAGFVSMLAQVLVAPASLVPNLGASGAIAGVMGAFLATYPRDRIRTVIILFIFGDIELLPAVLLIGIWFATQIVTGIMDKYRQCQLTSFRTGWTRTGRTTTPWIPRAKADGSALQRMF
jgi:membrane associated rhomboid family serine protease